MYRKIVTAFRKEKKMKILYIEKTSHEILQNYLSVLIKTNFKGFCIFSCLGAVEYACAALAAHYVHLREKEKNSSKVIFPL